MLGRKKYYSCRKLSNRLNGKYFLRTPKIFVIAATRSHNELAENLTKTPIDIPQVINISTLLQEIMKILKILFLGQYSIVDAVFQSGIMWLIPFPIADELSLS